MHSEDGKAFSWSSLNRKGERAGSCLAGALLVSVGPEVRIDVLLRGTVAECLVLFRKDQPLPRQKALWVSGAPRPCCCSRDVQNRVPAPLGFGLPALRVPLGTWAGG